MPHLIYWLTGKIVKTAWIFGMNILNIINPLLVREWLFDAVSADYSVIYPGLWCAQTIFVLVNIEHHINTDSNEEPEQ